MLDAVPVATAAPPTSIARTAGLGERAVVEALTRLRTSGFVEVFADEWRLGTAHEDRRARAEVPPRPTADP